jgi:Leucine-rich repeat (LRR) protein
LITISVLFVTQKDVGILSKSNTPTKETSYVKENKILDLSNQNLKSLPSDIFNKTNVEELNISKNQLTGSIPAEIRHLSELKILNASNNLMTGVPAEIGQLEKLEILNLSNNKLTRLPYELGNLINLKILDLSGNEYSQQDLDIIKKTLPADTKIIVN